MLKHSIVVSMNLNSNIAVIFSENSSLFWFVTKFEHFFPYSHNNFFVIGLIFPSFQQNKKRNSCFKKIAFIRSDSVLRKTRRNLKNVYSFIEYHTQCISKQSFPHYFYVLAIIVFIIRSLKAVKNSEQ